VEKPLLHKNLQPHKTLKTFKTLKTTTGASLLVLSSFVFPLHLFLQAVLLPRMRVSSISLSSVPMHRNGEDTLIHRSLPHMQRLYYSFLTLGEPAVSAFFNLLRSDASERVVAEFNTEIDDHQTLQFQSSTTIT